MKRRAVLLGLLASGCVQRGEFTAPPAVGPERTVRPIFLATNRAGPLGLARVDVSLPDNGATGLVTYDGADRFAVAGSAPLDQRAFFDALAETGPRDAPISLFVHGYNTNAAEAVYRHAQIARDFGDPGPQITFAWPSLGSFLGYVADRDAALRSRDMLESLLTLLARNQSRRILLLGHSMGGFLVAETLRQMALRQTTITDRLEAVVLISPDVDIELFRDQAITMGTLPQPFLVLISGRDRILNLSARLAGRRARLGSPDDLTLLRDLDLTVIDLSDTDGGRRGGHLQAVTSPEAVRWLRAIETSDRVLNERSGLQLIVPG